jgi:inosine-uridine nucleoside N-ribohydrolase
MDNKALSITLIITLSLFLTACAGKPEQNGVSSMAAPDPTSTRSFSPEGRLQILYEDDGSPDGTTALLYLLSQPQVYLEAASIVYGEAHPAIYIQHIGRVIESLGITEIPLGYGQDSPLSGNRGFPEDVRQAANGFWGQPVPNAGNSYIAAASPQLIVGLLTASPDPVMFFESGPLTNLAQALQLSPGIKDKISAVYLMGGAVYVPGNVADFYPDNPNKTAEWNIYGDVEAANIVFEAGIPIILVPLDATNQVLITAQDTAQWRSGGTAADLTADIYDMLLTSWNVQSAAIWDLMTAVIMLNPDLCTFTPLHLEIVTQEGATVGQTKVVPEETPNATVCLQPDAAGIRENLITVFSGASP